MELGVLAAVLVDRRIVRHLNGRKIVVAVTVPEMVQQNWVVGPTSPTHRILVR